MKTLMFQAMAAAMILAASPAATAASRRIDLRALSMADDFPGPEVFAHSPGSKEPGAKLTVKSYLNHESDPVTPSGDVLVITRQADAASAADKAGVLAEIRIPAKFKSGILLFLSPAKDKANGTLLVPDDKSAFPIGTTQVINSAKSDLRLEIEGKNFDVKAGGTLVIRDQPVGPSNSSSVKAYVKTDGKWVASLSTIWSHPGAKRVLQIATDNAQTGKVELHGVRDISTPR